MRGRTLATPSSDALRPTQDAVREAVFSMLRQVIPDCGFLDLFAGTGAVGLEALSRGAARVTWVEKSPLSLKLLERNVAACVGEPIPPALRIIRSDVCAWLRRRDIAPGSVDVVYADPPYVIREGEADDMSKTMELVRDSGMLSARAFFVAEQRARTPLPVCSGFGLLESRRYGKTNIAIFRYEPGE